VFPRIVAVVTGIVAGALLLALLALALVIPAYSTSSGPLPVAAQPAPTDPPSITVVGEGSASARPDQATIQVGVQVTRPTAVEALAEASRATEAVLAKLDELGIGRANVQTSGIGLFPVQEGNPKAPGAEPSLTGYRAFNQLTVLVRDLDRVGTILDGVVAAGANQVTGVRLGLSDDAPLRERAIQAAITTARPRADAMASGLRLKTDQVVSIREEGIFGPISAVEQGGKGGDGVPIEAGQLAVRVRIQVTFALVPVS
jgi:uncharacterized protein YggE